VLLFDEKDYWLTAQAAGLVGFRGCGGLRKAGEAGAGGRSDYGIIGGKMQKRMRKINRCSKSGSNYDLYLHNW